MTKGPGDKGANLTPFCSKRMTIMLFKNDYNAKSQSLVQSEMAQYIVKKSIVLIITFGVRIGRIGEKV